MASASHRNGPDVHDLLRRGEFRKAAKLLQLKIGRTPDDLSARLHLAEAFAGMGKADRALSIYVEEAEARLAGGERAAAVALLRRALAIQPGDAVLRARVEELEGGQPNAESTGDAFSFDLDADVVPAASGPGETRAGEDRKKGLSKGVHRVQGKRAFLESVFPALDEGRLDALLSQVRVRELDKDEVLLEEGEGGTSLFIIGEGLFEVRASLGGKERVLARLVPGDVIGEVALLKEVPRTATVKALVPSSALELALDKTQAAVGLGEGWDARLKGILEERLEGTLALLRASGKNQNGNQEG